MVECQFTYIFSVHIRRRIPFVVVLWQPQRILLCFRLKKSPTKYMPTTSFTHRYRGDIFKIFIIKISLCLQNGLIEFCDTCIVHIRNYLARFPAVYTQFKAVLDWLWKKFLGSWISIQMQVHIFKYCIYILWYLITEYDSKMSRRK